MEIIVGIAAMATMLGASTLLARLTTHPAVLNASLKLYVPLSARLSRLF
jgi:hypothetical protein